MTLLPFVIQMNRHPPFIGLFASSAAAWEAVWGFALSEAAQLGDCKLIIRALS